MRATWPELAFTLKVGCSVFVRVIGSGAVSSKCFQNSWEFMQKFPRGFRAPPERRGAHEPKPAPARRRFKRARPTREITTEATATFNARERNDGRPEKTDPIRESSDRRRALTIPMRPMRLQSTPPKRRCGGTGRRSGFKIRRPLKACRFNSCHRHSRHEALSSESASCRFASCALVDGLAKSYSARPLVEDE